MTQSTGAQTPEETTQPAEEKTVTTADLAHTWGFPAPESEVADLEKFMGVKGPFTPTEAAELDRRMHSLDPADRFPGYPEMPFTMAIPVGPHGPWCEREDDPGLLALLDLLPPDIAEALFGRTPAETRTGISDAEAAMAQELAGLGKRLRKFGKDCGEVGVYTASFLMDPAATAAKLAAASINVKKQAGELAASVRNLQAWLPQVKGTRTQATMDVGELKGLLVFLGDGGIQMWRTDAPVPPPAHWAPLYL